MALRDQDQKSEACELEPGQAWQIDWEMEFRFHGHVSNSDPVRNLEFGSVQLQRL